MPFSQIKSLLYTKNLMNHVKLKLKVYSMTIGHSSEYTYPVNRKVKEVEHETRRKRHLQK